MEKYQITDRGPRIVVTGRGQDARSKDVSEQELTYAIIKVAEQTSKKVFFLVGHGEGDIADAEHAEGFKALADAVAAEGYGIETLNLQAPASASTAMGAKVKVGDAAAPTKLGVPKDVALLVVNAPKKPLLDPEVAALEAYLNEGGRLLVMVEPRDINGMESLLHGWKVELRADVIVDTNPLNRLLGLGAAAPMIQPVADDHPITKDFAGAAVMLTARSVAVANGGLAGVDAQPLARTNDTAWGETHLGKDGTAAEDDKDNLPPLYVAVASQKDTKDAPNKRSDEARLTVFGDSDWVTNKYLGMQGNQDLVLNAVNWLAEEEEKIAIRPKSRAGSQLFLSGEQLGKLKFFSMDILPVLLVAAGLGIVLVRRQR